MTAPVTKRERVKALRQQGMIYREIAETLGISYGYAKKLGSNYSDEANRRDSRNAKRQRVGVCEICKGPTRYNGHSSTVSRRCADCNYRLTAERQKARAGTVGRTAEFLAFFAVPHRYSELRDHFGISSGYASVFLNRAHKSGWITRLARGIYIATGTPEAVTSEAASPRKGSEA